MVGENGRFAAKGADHLVRHDLHLVGIGLREHHRKLVPSHPRDDVRLAQALPQQPGDALEYVVAYPVAEGVVDVLEIIEVDEQHGPGGAIPSRALGLPGQFVLEVTSIEQAGEKIMVHHVFEAAREFLALGNVLDLSDRVERRPLFVPDHGQTAMGRRSTFGKRLHRLDK